MKSSSLGARLFEGLVQPILGSLWNSPPATIEKTGDTNNIDNCRQAHVQRPVSSVQPASGYAEASAMRGSARQQGELASVGHSEIRVAVPDKTPSRRHPEQVPTRPLGSGNRLVNVTALSEVHTVSGETPPTAQGRSRRKQTRASQRQTSCRLNESAQGLTKGASDASVAAASHTRHVVRHRTDAIPGAPVCVLKPQRTRQQKGDRRRKSTLTQASVILCEKQQCAGGKPNAPSVEAQGSQCFTINPASPQSAARAKDVANSEKWISFLRNNNGDGVITSCRGLNRIPSNSGPGSIYLTGRDDLRSCTKCNCGSDCSSSSTWGSEEGVFVAGNSGLPLGRSSDSTDIHRNVQAWLTTRAQCRGQQQEEQNRRLKQQPQQAQREPSALKCAASVEEGSCEARLHSWHSVAPSSEYAPVENSYSACSASSSCRPQCSDTTTTCSSSSMTSCGDARDVATGSAATTSEHAQHYLDIEEQMPLAFPSTTAGDPSRTVCREEAEELPCAQDDSHHVAAQYSSSHDDSSSTSSFICVEPAANTSTTAASTQFGNRNFGCTSLHARSILPCAQQEEAAAEATGDDTSNNIQAGCKPDSSSIGSQQHYQLRKSAARVAPPKKSSVNVPVTGQHEDSVASTSVKKACLADREIHYEEQEQQQSRQEAEGSTAGSVIFGHRVLKPLRSKSLDENYDALVEIVAFTKRRCEKETMELLRKDIHILYYARGLHHAAHVETYLQQQQNQKGKHQQQGPSTAASGNDSANVTSRTPSGGAPSAPGSAASQDLQPSSEVVAPAVATSAAEKRSPGTPCFPSVSAALASGARPRPVPEWATSEALRVAMERQQRYDPFSIFGEAPPELLLSEVYDEQHYTHISPQTRASHPVLARLKQQRRAALMAVFQQKRAALTRTQQLLEQELGQLQRQQRPSSQLQTPQEHGAFSSLLGRVVFSCGSVMQTAPTEGGVTSKANTSRRCGGSSSLLRLKSGEGEGNPECKSIKNKEAMLRLQQREVLVQQQLLERRLEDQLQQEERIYSEILRNGFRFLGAKANGGECGAALFKKRVLPALESWWQQQCQVELDWRNDPLTSEECSWYREVMNAAVDASDLISVQQACFCPTPPPYRQWTWTDCRVRQRKQHEQNLAKQRQEQLLRQQSVKGRHGLHGAIEWIDTGANAEQSDAEQGTSGQAGKCSPGEEVTGRCAADYDERSTGDTIGARLRGTDAEEIVEECQCDGESASGSVERKRNGQLLAGRTPSRRGRKRRAKEGDRTPQPVLENKVDIQGSERDTAAANNSGSARKRPRSFCRQAKKIQFYHTQAERSQSLQNVDECSSGRGCACSSRLPKGDNFLKQHCYLNSVAKANAVCSESVSVPTPANDKSSHASNAQSYGAEATTVRPHPLSNLNERRDSEINSSGAAQTAAICSVARRGNGRSGISPSRARLGCHALSTPVAKMQALKLSKHRYRSTAPLQRAQQRDKATERGQQQQLQCSHFAPSNKAIGLRRETSSHGQAFVSPNPVTAVRKTAGGHLTSSWTGNGSPDAAPRSAWDVSAGRGETVLAAAAVGSVERCGGGIGGAERGNITARGLLEKFSSAPVESRCRSGRTVKQLKMNTSQGLPRQLQRHVAHSARPSRGGCLSACNTSLTGHSVPGIGAHSRLAVAGVREVAEGRPVFAEPANTGFTGKNICTGENLTSRSLYLPSRSTMRPTTLLASRCARLSIDRVYGCRRTSDFFHSRSRSQFVLGSLVPPDITSAIHSVDNGVAADDVCKKDIECMNNEIP